MPTFKILDYFLFFQRPFGFNSTEYKQGFEQLAKAKRVRKHFYLPYVPKLVLSMLECVKH